MWAGSVIREERCNFVPSLPVSQFLPFPLPPSGLCPVSLACQNMSKLIVRDPQLKTRGVTEGTESPGNADTTIPLHPGLLCQEKDEDQDGNRNK